MRDGRFCAHPLLAHLNASDGAIRASVGVGTTSEAVDRLIDGADARTCPTGPASGYEIVDGCWAVVEDTRPLVAVHGLDHLAATAAAACGPALDD